MESPFLQEGDAVDWSALTPEHIVPDIDRALARAREAIAAVANTPHAGLTYETSFDAFERALEPLGRAWGLVEHLDGVANTPAFREAYNAQLPKITAFYSALYLDRKLWATLKAFAESPAAAALDAVRRRHCDEVCADFRENGADLPPQGRERLAEIDRELSAATQKFSENVLDATNAFAYVVEDANRLGGLPDVAVAAARADAEANGLCADGKPRWRFTLKEPSLTPVLQYADDAVLRKTLWTAANAVGREAPYDNRALVDTILALRHEQARLLGYADFSDYVLARRMARTGKRALAFIESMHARIAPFFKKECEELCAFKAAEQGGAPAPLAPWETAYYAEKLRRARLDFDPESLRPYFPMQAVVNGLFDLAQTLFAIEILPAPELPVWAADVRAYRVRDQRTGKFFGLFYADWFPRKEKQGGAWMNPLHTAEPPAPHIGAICGNLTPPTPETPSLLSHDEVTVIFHEFGHLLHHLFGEVPVRALNGTDVAWDFVELPSQILENWCWEPAVLARFARHWQTGAPLPADLVEKMRRARNFRAASFAMRQLSFAKMDLAAHIHAAQWRGALEENVRACLADYLAPTAVPAPTLLYRFGHLFSGPVGYAAGYYSYKWAEALEADAFTRFQKEGVLNPETARAFRETVLARGDAAPPETLFRDFMGRDPDPSALLRREGLA